MKERIAHCKQTKLAHFKKSNPNHQLVYSLVLERPSQVQLSKLLAQTLRSRQKIHIELRRLPRRLMILVQEQPKVPKRQRHPKLSQLAQISKRTLQSTCGHLQVVETAHFLLTSR